MKEKRFNRIAVSVVVLFVSICFWMQSSKCLGKEYYDFLEERSKEAKEYSLEKGLNEDYCIMVDYGIPSGTPRVFVWSFKEEKVVSQTYTMHGPGKGSTAKQPVFSNENGSKCSTLGHFAVTKVHGNVQKRGFRLNGLDPDNNNAYSRGIMIHNSIWVDTHCWMEYIPLNSLSCQGCVTVSSKGFKYLEKLIKKENKQILLWSFDSTKILKEL